jgi:ATP-binding cassette, subfamily B (MDR/TAP), member 1
MILQVVSFTGERRAIDRYNDFLKTSYRSAVHQGFAVGLGIGSLLLIIFCSYALAVWYGAKLIIEKGYTGGYIINVLMAIMTGAMSVSCFPFQQFFQNKINRNRTYRPFLTIVFPNCC